MQFSGGSLVLELPPWSVSVLKVAKSAIWQNKEQLKTDDGLSTDRNVGGGGGGGWRVVAQALL